MQSVCELSIFQLNFFLVKTLADVKFSNALVKMQDCVTFFHLNLSSFSARASIDRRPSGSAIIVAINLIQRAFSLTENCHYLLYPWQ